MPCKTVMATRTEAFLVLQAYDQSDAEGQQMYAQCIASYMQKNPHRGLPAANAHVPSRSNTSVRTLACVIDDERKKAHDSGDFTGIAPTKWAGEALEKRPDYTEGTLQKVNRDVHRRSVEEQNAANALRMASENLSFSLLMASSLHSRLAPSGSYAPR